MLALMKDRRVILSVLLYSLAGFVAIVTNEVCKQLCGIGPHTHAPFQDVLLLYLQVFPLMMVTGQGYGGYNMDGSEIGTVLMTVAVLQIVCMVRALLVSYSYMCHLHAINAVNYCLHIGCLYMWLHAKEF